MERFLSVELFACRLPVGSFHLIGEPITHAHVSTGPVEPTEFRKCRHGRGPSGPASGPGSRAARDPRGGALETPATPPSPAGQPRTRPPASRAACRRPSSQLRTNGPAGDGPACGHHSRRHRVRPAPLTGAARRRWAGTAASAGACCPGAAATGVVVERSGPPPGRPGRGTRAGWRAVSSGSAGRVHEATHGGEGGVVLPGGSASTGLASSARPSMVWESTSCTAGPSARMPRLCS